MDLVSQLGLELTSMAYIIGAVLAGLVGCGLAPRTAHQPPRSDVGRAEPDALPLCGHKGLDALNDGRSHVRMGVPEVERMPVPAVLKGGGQSRHIGALLKIGLTDHPAY